ncbi:MAG: hydrogenase nickel incorporation protein HypB [Thermoplasmata archaeon]|jgi:hydrogenase nickel incorporation protein HypB|nr:hydrogenase nickel incorporation protein HypB [Thermoplasmata archaeon]
MHKVVTVDMERDLLAENRRIANENRALLEKNGITAFDFLGGIGSGKTLIIEKLVDALKEKGKRCAAIAGDVSGDDDYQRFVRHGIPAANVNTGKECHLDAHLVDHALEDLPLVDIDYLFVENVGNLVCPVDFPVGSHKRVVVVSVTEGDDMVRKHPPIFAFSDVIIINKVDLADAMEVDPKVLERDARRINPGAKVIFMDTRRGKGMAELMEALGL